jgi:hypothetical protein
MSTIPPPTSPAQQVFPTIQRESQRITVELAEDGGGPDTYKAVELVVGARRMRRSRRPLLRRGLDTAITRHHADSRSAADES